MELILRYFPELTDCQRQRFAALYDLYADWNAKINVVSRKDFDQLYLRHVLHSLAIAKVCAFDAGARILDVGCGGGILAESMAREGATVTGLDMGFEPLQVAKLHALESGIQVDYVQETVEEHAAKHAGQYDVVTCMEMLEHVPDPQSVVRACAQLVKPGGDVFFSTLNRNGKSWLMAVVGAEYILRMVPKGTHDVKKFIKPAELLGWVDQTSLKERHITGLHYNPITNTFKLGPGVDVNYMLHTQNK